MSEVTTFIPLARVSIDEEQEQAVLEVLRSGLIAQGPVVEQLERLMEAITGASHAVAVSSGTTALELALRAAGIGPGDEVITAPITFGATLNAILHTGATARFADVGSEGNVDPAAVAALVNSSTAALLPVHLYGNPAPMPELEQLAARYGLAIIEDSAQAIGAAIDGRGAGSFGLGCFSLYATKNITSAEGGVITTSSPELAAELRLLRNQGMSGRYEYARVGFNARMTDVHAALAVPHLRRVHEITTARRLNAQRLNGGLAGLPRLTLPAITSNPHHVFHQYTIRLDSPQLRTQVTEELTSAGIGYGLIYPQVVYDYDCYRRHPAVVADPVPKAEELVSTALSLPVHPHLTDWEVERIVTAVRAAVVG